MGDSASCESRFATRSASRRSSAIGGGQFGNRRVELGAVDLAVHIGSEQGFRFLVEDEPFKANAAASVIDRLLAASALVVG
jgi:hypothetical protein